MPQRETTRRETLILRSLESVDQRVQATELPPTNWVEIYGTFPEFTGLQGKIFGRRLLKKYANPIMGIAQFWTPYGYAGGIYQFTDEVDFGVWLTPYSKFPDLTLPPAILFNNANLTVDDFGFAPFTITPGGFGTPDDSNGGPAGQGTHCKWVNTSVVSVPGPYTGGVVSTISPSYSTVLSTGPDPGPYSPSSRVPLGSPPVGVPVGSILTPNPSAGYTIGSLVTHAFGNYTATQNGNATYHNCVLDLTPMIAIFGTTPLNLVIVTLQITKYINFVASSVVNVTIPVDFSTSSSYAAFPISMSDYLPTQVTTNNGSDGLDAEVQAIFNTITLTFRKRVCA